MLATNGLELPPFPLLKNKRNSVRILRHINTGRQSKTKVESRVERQKHHTTVLAEPKLQYSVKTTR